jgi:signal transduction histidine kinase
MAVTGENYDDAPYAKPAAVSNIRHGRNNPTHGRYHMNRRWTIRARITTLLLAPVIPLLAMLVFATTVALGPALNLRDARTAVDDAGTPVGTVIGELQSERQLSVINVSSRVPSSQETSGLTSTRAQTDAGAKMLDKLSTDSSFLNAANPSTIDYLTKLRADLEKLPAERASVDAGASRASVMVFYNDALQTTFDLYGSIARLDDHTLQQKADAVVGLAEADEFLSREDALVEGTAVAGVTTLNDYNELVATVSTRRFLFGQAAKQLTGKDQATYAQITGSPQALALTKLEDALTARYSVGSSLNLNLAVWKTDYGTVANGMTFFELALAQNVINGTGDAANLQEIRLGVAIGASVLMLLVLLFFSLRIARALIRRVAGLRMDALSLALDRLPSVVGRLRRGEPVDLKAETPPLRYGFDELGQLGDAFTRVQETAVSSAVHEANLRHGFNQVFLNIARRSQTLLHRQLALLDTMERRTEDPDQLEELFRVDHLATRMRRHAEDLVILAGSTPGRGWRNPIPFADVLRAAASEVEEYARISVVGVPDLGLAGRAVNDVVHLLAELLENATMFSPPTTQVTMSGQSVPNGFVIEIEDRGLGMSLASIDDANARLASPPDFDPANSSRLGLFVVSRLAARHGITVGLRRSPYGGVTAVTLIPAELVVAPSEITPGAYRGGLGARLPMPRTSADDTAERPVAGSPPAGDAVFADVTGDATLMLTMDGLPKRSRQASLPARQPEVPMRRNNGSDETSLSIGVGPNGTEPRNNAGPDPLTGPYPPSNGPYLPSRMPTEARRDAGTPPAPRTPEQMRTMLSSFQDAMALGRRDGASTARHANPADSDGLEPEEERHPE